MNYSSNTHNEALEEFCSNFLKELWHSEDLDRVSIMRNNRKIPVLTDTLRNFAVTLSLLDVSDEKYSKDELIASGKKYCKKIIKSNGDDELLSRFEEIFDSNKEEKEKIINVMKNLQSCEKNETSNLKKSLETAYQTLTGRKKTVHDVKFNLSSLYGIRSALIKTFVDHLDATGRTVLGTTWDSILFFGQDLKKDEISNVKKKGENYIQNELVDPVRTISLNHAQFQTGVFGIVEPTKDMLREFTLLGDNLKNFLYITSQISGTPREEIEGYEYAAENFNKELENSGVPLRLKKDKPEYEYDGEKLIEEHQDFLVRAGMLRCIQHLCSKLVRLTKWEKTFKQFAEEYEVIYTPLYPQYSYKAGIIPILFAAHGKVPDLEASGEYYSNHPIDNEKLLMLVKKSIKDIEGSPFKDYDELFGDMLRMNKTITLNHDKKIDEHNMCIATGKQGYREAKTEVLHGINRQTFTNRANISMSTNAGQVSPEYALEARIRKAMTDNNSDDPLVMFARFPGITPHVDVGKVLSMVIQDASYDNERSKLSFERNELTSVFDDCLFTTFENHLSETNAIASVYSLQQLFKQLKLQVVVQFSTEPLESEYPSLLCLPNTSEYANQMGYHECHLDEVANNITEMKKFRSLSDSNDFRNGLHISIVNFLTNPLYSVSMAEGGGTSLEYLFSQIGDDIVESMKKVAKAAYKVQKSSGKNRQDRKWLFTEPIYTVLENEVWGGKLTLEESVPVIAGHIQQKSLSKNRKMSAHLEKGSEELARAIVDFVDEHWDGKMPDDQQMENATNTFIFLYTHLTYNGGEWKFESTEGGN